MGDDRPNMVFVLCDSTGWGDFSCYGGITPTPRIDKFASEGIQGRHSRTRSNTRRVP
jgi:arylsulfatase A-like enzyme